MASAEGRVKATQTIERTSTAYGECKILPGTEGQCLSIPAGQADVAVDWDWALRQEPSTGNFDVKPHIICPVPLAALAAA